VGMPSLEDILGNGGLGRPSLVQSPVPTRAQLEEVEKVRGMQVRTQALQAAVTLLAGNPHGNAEWHVTAEAMERYILG
jgi:hypothetical protein